MKLKKNFNVGKRLISNKERWIIDNSDLYLRELDKVLLGKKPDMKCTCAYTTIFIDWEFNLYICKAHLETGRVFMNLKEIKDSGRSLKEIWFSKEYDEKRIFCKTCNECFLTVNREFDALFKLK